jgi:hypothetical protein
MSAPYEVFIHHKSAHTRESLESQPAVVRRSVLLTGIRYLRADLTCGECCIDVCAHDFDNDEAYSDYPACMAFVLKETKE